MGSYRDYIERMKRYWIGKRVLFRGGKYTVVDIDYNASLMIDLPTQHTETTAVSETMVKVIEETEETPMDRKAKSEYDQGYMRENITRKLIPFNKTKPEDMEILEWLQNQPEGMTAYIKRLIREDMKR